MISIIIPAYNEEKYIGACLDALVRQKTARKFEVIIVDNNSTDRTAEVARAYDDRLDVHIVTEKQKGRGPARWRGFREAQGDILFSTDADTIVPQDWIEKSLTVFESDNRIAAVTGPCAIRDCTPLKNTVFNFIQPLSMKLYRIFFGHYWLSGFNFAIRRDAYESSGGFSPLLNAQEDIDLSLKVAKVGRIHYLPMLVVIFSGRRFQRGLLKGCLQYVRTFFSLFLHSRKHAFLDDRR